jgi:hypothetical protein
MEQMISRLMKQKMCRIPEFSEAWDIDDSENAPRDDRHRQKWKWLNETTLESNSSTWHR